MAKKNTDTTNEIKYVTRYVSLALGVIWLLFWIIALLNGGARDTEAFFSGSTQSSELWSFLGPLTVLLPGSILVAIAEALRPSNDKFSVVRVLSLALPLTIVSYMIYAWLNIMLA